MDWLFWVPWGSTLILTARCPRSGLTYLVYALLAALAAGRVL